MKSHYLKLLPLLFLIVFIADKSFGQSVGDKIILKSYCKAKTDSVAYVNKNVLIDTLFVDYLEPNIIFIINSLGDDEVSLTAVDFTKLKKPTELKHGEFDKSLYYNKKIYKIERKVFDRSYDAYEEKERMSIGLLTLPFKARPQDDFSFDTEFNLSTTLNIRLRDIIGASLNAQFGAGIGSVNLNSSNANGIEPGKEQDVAILNFFTGLMFQYKSVQAGIYIGVDQINNQSEYQWKHNGNLWLGFGIGFNIFQISLGDEENEQK